MCKYILHKYHTRYITVTLSIGRNYVLLLCVEMYCMYLTVRCRQKNKFNTEIDSSHTKSDLIREFILEDL